MSCAELWGLECGCEFGKVEGNVKVALLLVKTVEEASNIVM